MVGVLPDNNSYSIYPFKQPLRCFHWSAIFRSRSVISYLIRHSLFDALTEATSLALWCECHG